MRIEKLIYQQKSSGIAGHYRDSKIEWRLHIKHASKLAFFFTSLHDFSLTRRKLCIACERNLINLCWIFHRSKLTKLSQLPFFFSLQGGSSGPRSYQPSGTSGGPPHQLKGNQQQQQQRPSAQSAMTSPAGAIAGAPYRGASWTPSYAPATQQYRYSAPLAAQPTYAYTTTQHSTVSTSLS